MIKKILRELLTHVRWSPPLMTAVRTTVISVEDHDLGSQIHCYTAFIGAYVILGSFIPFSSGRKNGIDLPRPFRWPDLNIKEVMIRIALAQSTL